MATLQSFHPWVSLDCPGVPSPILDDAVREGAREFCKRTHCLEVKTPLTTVVAQADYALTLPTDTELLEVEEVRRSASSVLSPTTEAALDATSAQSGMPSQFAVIETNPRTLRLSGVPVDVETLTVKCVVMPTPTADTLDDRLFDWHLRGITAYAKYLLMSQPGKGWSNPEQAAFEYRRFDSRAADTKIRRDRSRSGLEQRVQMHPLA